ncbi:hypothetical protein V5R04_05725 [Jonesiaceae bacterium BS-20]|uniref:Integron gene cassette protein n=1 Tax=Jonesiaceae bacterium BS-20 TaxID=3120821 RepID=A0AAU7DZD8_9MICO
MTQVIATTRRISRKDLIFLVGIGGAFLCALLFQYLWVESQLVRGANITLFALLGVYFLQRAYCDRSKQSRFYSVVLVVGGLAWLIFATLIALGKASGF